MGLQHLHLSFQETVALHNDDDDSDTESDAEVHMDIDEVGKGPVKETIADIANKLTSKLEKLNPKKCQTSCLLLLLNSPVSLERSLWVKLCQKRQMIYRNFTRTLLIYRQ